MSSCHVIQEAMLCDFVVPFVFKVDEWVYLKRML